MQAAQHFKSSRCVTGPPSSPSCTAVHAYQLCSSKRCRRTAVRVANPRNNDDKDVKSTGTGSWDEDAPVETGQEMSSVAFGIDWGKVQSLAALLGASTLATVLAVQLTGKADLESMVYQTIPEPLQEALPQLNKSNRLLPLFDVGAVVQNVKVGLARRGQPGRVTDPSRFV